MCVCVSWAGKAETVSLTPTMFVMRTCDFQVNGREENLKLHLAERKSQKYPGALGSSQFTPRCRLKRYPVPIVFPLSQRYKAGLQMPLEVEKKIENRLERWFDGVPQSSKLAEWKLD